MTERTTIRCKPNGPYLVERLGDLKGARGEGLETKPVLALCRCGGSANKPFCDGTHRNNGFSDTRLSDGSTDKRESYRAGGVTIHDNRSICAHAGRCTEGLPAVFKYQSEPWIEPDAAAIQQIVEIVAKCPSGALSCSVDGAQAGDVSPPAPGQPLIVVAKDGPYEVSGGAELLEVAWAQGASSERYTLCRCGGSRNKPFCDGTHWRIGFKDPIE